MPRNSRDYDWLDDAFDESKPDPLACKGDRRGKRPGGEHDGADVSSDSVPHSTTSDGRAEDYDWIDDAFDESKPDPLARKGAMSSSGPTIAIVVIALVLVAAVTFFCLSALFSLPL